MQNASNIIHPQVCCNFLLNYHVLQGLLHTQYFSLSMFPEIWSLLSSSLSNLALLQSFLDISVSIQLTVPAHRAFCSWITHYSFLYFSEDANYFLNTLLAPRGASSVSGMIMIMVITITIMLLLVWTVSSIESCEMQVCFCLFQVSNFELYFLLCALIFSFLKLQCGVHDLSKSCLL